MKRTVILMTVFALMVMFTATQPACADDDGIEIGDAELTLAGPAPAFLSEEDDGDDGPIGGDCEFK